MLVALVKLSWLQNKSKRYDCVRKGLVRGSGSDQDEKDTGDDETGGNQSTLCMYMRFSEYKVKGLWVVWF